MSMGHHYYCMIYVYHCICRYQPGSLNSSAEKKKVELLTLTEMENMKNLEKKLVDETFSPRHLLLPSSESPTKISGLIVYVTTAVVCKSSFTDKLCLSVTNTFLVFCCMGIFFIVGYLDTHTELCNSRQPGLYVIGEYFSRQNVGFFHMVKMYGPLQGIVKTTC